MSIHDLFVTGYLRTGLALSALVLGSLVLARWLRDASPSGAVREPIVPRQRLDALHWGLIVFVAILVSRLLILPLMFDPSALFSDEGLESCVCPWQQKLGLPLWGSNTNHVHYSFSRVVLDTLGYDVTALRAFHAFRFALAASVFVALLHGTFNGWVLLGVAGLLTASYPFVVHSIWSTSLGSGALPALLVFGILGRREPVSPSAAIVLGVLTGASIYVYPGATLAIACGLLFHALLYRERWRPAAFALAAASLVATKLLLDWLYQTPFLESRYGGGTFSLEHLLDAWTITPLDFFYRSTSWATFNFEAPYFEPVLIWTLILALASRSRFFWFSLGVFALNLLLVGFTGPYPGARRALWSLPLLYLGCLQATLALAARAPQLARVIEGGLVVSLALLCIRVVVIGADHFPLHRPDAFYRPAVAFLASHAPLEPEVVLLEDRKLAFGSREYWCALGFTRRLWNEDEQPTLLAKRRRHGMDPDAEHWVLMQTWDSLADVQRVFGRRETEFLYPAGVPAHELAALPNRSPLRVLRVGPASEGSRRRPSRR